MLCVVVGLPSTYRQLCECWSIGVLCKAHVAPMCPACLSRCGRPMLGCCQPRLVFLCCECCALNGSHQRWVPTESDMMNGCRAFSSACHRLSDWEKLPESVAPRETFACRRRPLEARGCLLGNEQGRTGVTFLREVSV